MRSASAWSLLAGSSTRFRCLAIPSLACLALLTAAEASAAIIPGRVVLQTGDAPTGAPLVTSVGEPSVNGAGEVGMTGELDDGDHFVFVADSVVWLGSDDMAAVLTAPELSMDSDGSGHWVYAPTIDGLDGVYTDAGALAVEGEAAVGFPGGAVYATHYRPSMTADGAVYWLSTVDVDGDGDADVQGFYRSPDGTPASIELLLAGGTMVDMFVIDDATAGSDGGIDGDYSVSEDGAHRLHVLNMEGDPVSDAFLLLDDTLVLREGDDTGEGDAWDNFDLVSVNAGGNYLVSGNTDGPEETDEYVAYNGVIGVREGSMIGDVTLTDASLRMLALNDQEQATHTWGYQLGGSFRETVFFSCNAADLGNSSLPVVTTFADSIDIDNDGTGDYTVEGVNSSVQVAGRALGEELFVYVAVEIDDGSGATDAIVEIPVICCGNGLVDPMEECDDQNDDNEDDCLDTCLMASCGDGFLQAGVEECDDGNTDDTDDCPSTCVPASCGDGFVQAGVEECDDGNTDDADDCANDCTMNASADGTMGSTGVDTTDPPDGSGTDDSGTTGDTDTAGAGDDGGGGGCGCQTRDPAQAPAWALFGLGLLALRRRRRG